MDERIFRVDRGRAGMRLDLFLCEMLPRMSRAYLQKLIEDGVITRESVPLTKASMKVFYDDIVHVNVPPPVKMRVQAEDIPITILHEDDDLAVVEKPAGMVVHPASGHRSGTLVNALLHHMGPRLSGVAGVARPGLVHRLDKDVSGLILIAKHDRAHFALQAKFKGRLVEKTYLALVWGNVKTNEGRIHAPIARHRSNRKKMAVLEGGKDSLTLYRVVERIGKEATFLEVDLKTGRSHQIRVHLAHIGHAIVGDSLYGGGPARTHRPELREAVQGLGRIALHAWRLSFIHPGTERRVSYESPAPEVLRALIETFRAAITPEASS
jgi:23S rRNA pseudouridine1911/1915/1917 synthase